MFSDLLGFKFDAKTGDVLGNLKVFVLGVGCLVLGVWFCCLASGVRRQVSGLGPCVLGLRSLLLGHGFCFLVFKSQVFSHSGNVFRSESARDP